MNNEQRGWRPNFHLTPPTGWMNDPNGLCWFQGSYHVFFQYAPSSPVGKERFWGHYISEDLVSWRYVGIALYSDIPQDQNGAYSGCGFVEDGRLELFYTGNVKEKGDYDYIHAGRQANVLTTESEDGIHFGKKRLLLTNEDYPEHYTCHVRDPKVWKKDNWYYMILGGRRTDGTGAVLQYRSKDKEHWQFTGEITTREPFGYMWECPDTFELSGTAVLMCCPQGVVREHFRFQNIHQSGYFILDSVSKERLTGFCSRDQFHSWDFGFDFYAPQTMEDCEGRRILIGWAGMPDMEQEYRNDPTLAEGWQHCLTVPRELIQREGRICQYPIGELRQLRGEEAANEAGKLLIEAPSFDIEAEFEAFEERVQLLLNDEAELSWEKGVFSVCFLNGCGYGREQREIELDTLKSVRILKDVCMLEIFINGGAEVFTSRYFPKTPDKTMVWTRGVKKISAWPLKSPGINNSIQGNCLV